MSEQKTSSKVRGVETTVDFKKRSDIHWARKIWHMGGVSFLASLYAFLPENVYLLIISAIWLMFVPLDFARQKNKGINDLLLHLFRPVLRQSEVHKIAGTTYLITGVAIVSFIFPREIVLLTLLFLAFADPFASYFGIRFGKDKIFGEKSVQGSLAAFVICAALTFAFLNYRGLIVDKIIIVSLLGGLIGAVAELLPIGKLDDNLTLPLISATALYFLFNLFGAFSIYA